MGGDSEGFQSANLLVYLHGPELSGERGARPATKDDTGHDAPHLPNRCNTHQVCDVNGCAKPLKFNSPDKSQNQAH